MERLTCDKFHIWIVEVILSLIHILYGEKLRLQRRKTGGNGRKSLFPPFGFAYKSIDGQILVMLIALIDLTVQRKGGCKWKKKTDS